jgi:flagellar protein FlbD
MIKLTRFDGSKFTLNSELIVLIEETPDTVITLTTGQKFVVKEAEPEVVENIIRYRQKVTYINREIV